jgi:CCR4-NOT transcriptional regulation complex NOT5 subunit
MCADNVFGQIGLEITHTHTNISICNSEVVCPRTAVVRKIREAEAAEHDRELLKI